MKNKLFYWLPRVLSILFIIFISIFALDAFEESNWLLALIMHLIPSFILTLVTILAWKKEKLGGIVFLILVLILFIPTRGHLESLPILIPPAVIGILFLIQQ